MPFSGTPSASQCFLGKAVVGTLVLAAALLIGMPAVGLVLGEDPLGNLSQATIYAAMSMDLAVALSFGASDRMQLAARTSWAALALTTLALALFLLDPLQPDSYKAADTVLIIVMFILAFPASIAAVGLVYVYSVAFAGNAPTSLGDLIVYWLCFFGAGFLQWHILIPLAIRKFRSAA